MSSLYNLEPQPTAKVVLQTTSGDLSLELFAKQTPLASRNFLQHCLDGYYNNTIFHRLVPGFIVQGGDPTGSGSGGISALQDGELFRDEFHSRLKYTRRGLLGMANEGKDSNGSQFFFTLGSTPELQGKNTLFGRIEGDTIYNLMKMGEAELTEGENSERPLFPTRIIGAEVLVNPFDDMIVRAKEAPRSKEDEGKKQVKKRKKIPAKNVLSFADEEEQEQMVAPVLKKAKANPKLVVVEEEVRNRKSPKPVSKETLVRPEVIATPVTIPSEEAVEEIEAVGKEEDEDEDEDDEPEQLEEIARRKKLEKTNAEIAALKASMKRNVDVTSTAVKEKPKGALEALIPSTSTRGRRRGKTKDEAGAIDMFKAFKQRLEDLPDDTQRVNPDRQDAPKAAAEDVKPATDKSEQDEADLCDLHFIANCESCRAWDTNANGEDADGDGGDDDAGWMTHSLSFAKDTLGKDLEWKKKMAEIEVIDPREKARAFKEERRKNRDKGKR